MLKKQWEIIGYKKTKITENDDSAITHIEVARKFYDSKPSELFKIQFCKDYDADCIAVEECYANVDFLEPSDIDTSNTVFFEFSNPLYHGDMCNKMELSFEYPAERTHMIRMIKLAVRCGLDIKFGTENGEASEWLYDYYEMYRS